MVAVLTPESGGKPIVIDKAVVLIGRHPDCDYILQNSRKVSRRHLCIVQVNDKYLVRDLGSMNGVQVNGERVKRSQVITIGDEIAVGDVVFRFEQIQKLPRPARNGDGAQGEPAAPPAEAELRPLDRNPDLSQNYPVPIPEEDESFQLVQDAIPLDALRHESDASDEVDQFDDSDIDEVLPIDEDEDYDEDRPVPIVEALAGSVDEFVPVLDADATFDESEIEEVVLLDEEPDNSDDDIIVLD